MRLRSLGRTVFLAALSAGLLGWTSAATAAEPDPWTRVPAFPTGCYQTDGFADKLEAADEAIKHDEDRQDKINSAISAKTKEIDPMELASRQQQYMMDHPQEAMKLMQRNSDLGQSSTRLDNYEKVKKLVEELAGIDARYNAALDERVGPFKKKFKDLDDRAQKDLVVIGESYAYAPWAVKEWNALTLAEGAAYEKLCAEWWAPSGPYRGWLDRYRAHLVQDEIPFEEEADAVGAGFLVIILSTPEISYKSTAKLRAIGDYLDRVKDVFAKRRPFTSRLME
jgi:hypothetical protein